jgi:hypothetical protein
MKTKSSRPSAAKGAVVKPAKHYSYISIVILS